MSAVEQSAAEVVRFDEAWARRVDTDLRLAIRDYDNASGRILRFIDEAQAGRAWTYLGFSSWTAYASDVWSGNPVHLAAPERREFVAALSERGMSTRAIAPIVGVSQKTVDREVVQDETAGAQEDGAS